MSATMHSVVSKQARDARAVLERAAGDLHRVDDAVLAEVGVLVGVGIEAVVLVLLLADIVDDHGAITARVLGDHLRRHRAAASKSTR